MKKKCCIAVSGLYKIWKSKTLRVMRIVLFLIAVGITQALAFDSYAQSTRLSLNFKNETIVKILDKIEDESEFYFMYDATVIDVNQKRSINCENKAVTKILDELFQNTGITYKIDDRQIALSVKNEIADKLLNVADQQTAVSGKVTDSNGQPLPGVTVVVKGTTNGTVTNTDGEYSLTNIPADAILQFSFVGMKMQEVVVGNQASINITMAEEAIGIEEVVAIGYGTMKKSDLTGSISSVSTDDIREEPIQQMEQVLQGRVSGVSVTTTSGAPDGSIHIRVRGANSINGGNEPLYVVDGVANSDLFNSLDVNDIQSIEVLKDASSTAIYGSRGANGVVLVTTKKGINKEFEIQYETQQSMGVIAKKYDMLSASEFANFYNEYRKNLGASDNFYSDEQIAEWEKTGGLDWQDLLYQTAYTQNHKLSVSGGKSKVHYIISGNVRDAEGVLIKSKYKKYGLRANIDAQTFDWLNINFEVNGSHNESNKNQNSITGVGGAVWQGLTYSPTLDLMDENGNWVTDNVSSYQDNPYGKRIQDLDDRKSNFFGGNIKFTIDLPVKGLSFNIMGSAHYRSLKTYNMYSKEKALSDKNSAYNSEREWFSLQNTNQLTYTNTWGDHRLTATVIAEYMQNTYNQLYVGVDDLLTESVEYWNLGLGSVSEFGNSYSKNTLASYLGRAMYQFKDKYLFTATLRRDGSSKFQGDNQWGYFPSFAFAWRASEESFIKKLNIFDYLKIRASYGITGNQAIEAYSTLGMLSRSNYGWGTSGTYPGYWAENSPTPDLTWEKTYQWDAGIDLGFFDNRLSATIDFYLKNTKDLLLEKSIPYYDGGGSVYMNLGHVRNKGVEVSINVIPVKTNNLNWESSLNLAYSKNKIIDMGGDERLFPGDFNNLVAFNPSVLEVGQPMGSFWGYTWLGLWGTDEADEAAKYGQKPGDNKILDKNTDYVINSEDQGVIGQAFPDYTFGWNNTISWQNFDFNVFFQGSIGADRLNLTRYGISENISDARFVTSKEGYYNMWTPDNQDTNIPNIYSTSINTQAGSTQYLESADFLRLKNLSVGYNIPLKKSNVLSGIKVSASVQNLLTITGYSGYDPEVTSSGTNDIRAGIEEGAYPLPRTYTFGLRINFN
jgi:TonB-linked SusC/RagA family outer membrane protein